MRKIFVIAARDYRAAVKTKSFVISLLIMPLMMGGSILVQLLLKDKVDITDKRFAVVDRTGGALAARLEAEADIRNSKDKKEIFNDNGKQIKPKFIIEKLSPEPDTPEAIDQLRYELSEKVRKQELFGFLEIGPDVGKFERRIHLTGNAGGKNTSTAPAPRSRSGWARGPAASSGSTSPSSIA